MIQSSPGMYWPNGKLSHSRHRKMGKSPKNTRQKVILEIEMNKKYKKPKRDQELFDSVAELMKGRN